MKQVGTITYQHSKIKDEEPLRKKTNNPKPPEKWEGKNPDHKTYTKIIVLNTLI